MANYPRPEYSLREVKRVGEFLRKPILVGDDFDAERKSEVIAAFAVANSFRESHVLPMRSVRLMVAQRMRRLHVTGLTASRPKRMRSIRRKLAEGGIDLHQINDLAGVRVIADDSVGVSRIIDSIRSEFRHTIRKEYPYIERPKPDGYRSHHMVFEYVGEGDKSVYDGRRIELQVRTRLQHSWATAVEAMGLFRGEDLKHGAGDADWLRFFALVSAEFARVEGCAIHADMPGRSVRLREIRDLNARLGAVQALENVKTLTNYRSNFVHEPGRYYLIRYGTDHRVRVESFWTLATSSASLRELEAQIELGAEDARAVLVEVDKIDKLVETYPNYFGDVTLFVRNLRLICDGRDAMEFSMVPQERVHVPRLPAGDPRDLRRRYSGWADVIDKATKR